MQFIKPEYFISKSESIPIIDVRSPGEFDEGHIPGAINIPLFDNEERTIVGTLYKNEGRQPAIEKGLEIVGPKMVGFVRQVSEIAVENQLLVHCWRGGMRSESMAWLFERVGIKCFTLEGGYKAYRNFLLEKINHIPKLIVVDGHTGSGKTEILIRLKELGEQVIDLEGLANHRGSAFGGIGQPPQPSTQQFQNELFGEVLAIDRSKRVWIEGESQLIGRVFLPDPFWQLMNESQNIELYVPRQNRVERLVREYGDLPKELMENAISRITKKLGEQRAKEIIQEYREGKLEIVANKLLDYYDKTYQFGRVKHKKNYPIIDLPDGNAANNAKILLERIVKIEKP